MDQIDFVRFLLAAVVAVVAITFHEAAHGYVACRLGDDTALKRGRVTLNPLKHIDLVGTLLLPMIMVLSHAPVVFGYAKPVPVKWRNLRQPKRDAVLVAAAGPFANLLLAAMSGLAVAALRNAGTHSAPLLITTLDLSAQFNLFLGVFNLLPIPPLDGSKVVAGFLPARVSGPYLRLGRFGFWPVVIVILGLPLLAMLIGFTLRTIPSNGQ